MKVTNRVFFEGLSMEDYKLLPGFNFSSIKHKGQDFVPTEKMRLGTMVHQYISESHLYDHTNQNHKLVKSLAIKLKETLGSLEKHLKGEVSFVCRMEHEGLYMPYKGRVDGLVPGRIVIDYKIINGKSIYQTLKMFGYEDQLSGYLFGAGCQHAFIFAASTVTKEVEVVHVKPNSIFWEQEIIKNGILI